MLSSVQNNLIRVLRTNPPSDPETIFRAMAFILENERKLLETAAAILDEGNAVKRIVSNSTGRQFWLVSGKQGRRYVVFEHFCQCRSFRDVPDENYISRSQDAKRKTKVCKHMIAVHLAECIKDKIDVKVMLIHH